MTELHALDWLIRAEQRKHEANSQMAQYFTELALANQVELDSLLTERTRLLGTLATDNVIPLRADVPDISA